MLIKKQTNKQMNANIIVIICNLNEWPKIKYETEETNRKTLHKLKQYVNVFVCSLFGIFFEYVAYYVFGI